MTLEEASWRPTTQSPSPAPAGDVCNVAGHELIDETATLERPQRQHSYRTPGRPPSGGGQCEPDARERLTAFAILARVTPVAISTACVRHDRIPTRKKTVPWVSS